MDLIKIYSMGVTLQYIKRCPVIGAEVKGENFLLDNLNRLYTYLEELKISPITRYDINLFIKRCENYKGDEQLNTKDAFDLQEYEKLWTDRISNELMDRVTIEVFTDGTLNYKKIILGGKSFFPEDVWGDLSPISQSDLNDACNCLLTRSWTPAVMISLRASEDSIRKLYEAKTENKAKLGWKQILDELSKLEGANKTLIGYLDYIREMRNTAEHPDKIFNQMDAERAFHQVVDVIIVIHKELEATRQTTNRRFA